MNFEEYFEAIIHGILKQQKVFNETGIMPELELIGHVSLAVSPDDTPELRRRIITFKAKLAEWNAIGMKHNFERNHANFICIENLTAIFGDHA